ncbi:MAG: type II secretion system protein GspK [Ottowia sp.]|uniref:general secretion pathway protein GspK n=1 Tax=Ottowia sp. TaxID=1898956 RepID=UPI0039E502FF
MRRALNSTQGMALIAVLWIVAALSVMVTGLTHTVRQQIQAAGIQRDQVSGQALGEAAIALALQQLQAGAQRPTGIVADTVSYAGAAIEVEAAPLDGLIPLGGASAELLAALLRVAGGLDDAQARALAQTLVEWRDGRPGLDLSQAATVRAMQRRFEAPEDLLLVPGVDYALYARIAPLVSADLGSASRVNPEAAPPEVLAVLAQGDAARVAQYVSQRAGSQLGADASGFNPAFVGRGASDVYRLRARVPLEAGKMLLLTRDVALDASASRSAPWRVLRTERQIVVLPG